MDNLTLITFVVPCFNEAGSIERLYTRMNEVFSGLRFDVVLVDDGSSDNSLAIIKKLVRENDNVTGVSFSRNFGKEAAILAGLHKADGRYTCLIDADLQQDPDVAKRMVDILENDENIDCVCAVPEKRVEGKFTNFVKDRFYKVINSLSSTKFEENASDFRTFRTNVKQSLISLKENNRFSKGLFSWVGYKTIAIEYEVKPRFAGNTNWSFRSLLNYALNGIVSFSTKPLKFSLSAGFILFALSVVYAVFAIVRFFSGTALCLNDLVIFLILFCSAIQLVMIGILGYYIADIHIQSKHRPIYIVKENVEND